MIPSWAHDSAFWRTLAAWGAQRGPAWFVRGAPPLIGLAASVALPEAASTIRSNLRLVRGNRAWLRDQFDVGVTFANYAGHLAESLASGSKRETIPVVRVEGRASFDQAMAENRGIIFATAHTGGWERIGRALAEQTAMELMLVMARERDARAQTISDQGRLVPGARIVHVGDGPLDGLPVLRHLQSGGAVGIQMDRTLPGMRGIPVRFFGQDWTLPEGPFRLAQWSGAPLLPVFAAREGLGQYRVRVGAPLKLKRDMSFADLEAFAQGWTDIFAEFLREFPTQWFHFQPSPWTRGAVRATSRGKGP